MAGGADARLYRRVMNGITKGTMMHFGHGSSSQVSQVSGQVGRHTAARRALGHNTQERMIQ